MEGNPSTCSRFFDPAAGRERVICDCASGYFGSDTCKSIDAFVRLPPFVSPDKGFVLRHKALRHPINYPVEVSKESSQIRDLLKFELDLANGENYTVVIPAVYTVWGFGRSENDPSGYDYTWRKSIQTIKSSLFSKDIFLELAMPNKLLNKNVPANLSFALHEGAVLPLGFRFSQKTGAFTGAEAQQSGVFFYTLQATESYSGETANISEVTIVISDCGDSTCLNGGICDAGTNDFDGNFSCSCPANSTGVRCDKSLVREVTPPGKSTDLTKVAIVTVVVVVVSIALIVAVVHWRIRQVMISEMTKIVHIFIR